MHCDIWTTNDHRPALFVNLFSLQSTRELTLGSSGCRVARHCSCAVGWRKTVVVGFASITNGSDCCGIWPPRVIDLRFSSTCVSLQCTRELTLGSSGCRVARHCAELSGGDRSLLTALRTPCWRLSALWYFCSNCAFRQPVFEPKHSRNDTGFIGLSCWETLF